ncbi:hypothetical protein NMG60_11036378 [Bertholletia excelsa]
MSPAAQLDQTFRETSPSPQGSITENRRFGHLRGVQWRIDLGILPSSSSSLDDFRRVTADSRRRYAGLRRYHLLADPSKDLSNSPDLIMDNPLSQNPDSIWVRFFQNAELERTVDQDLSRLYPEHGSYFQTRVCQSMLRRILLLWCLRHPNYGYRQGMHELLAPLLYVLHIDVEYLSQVRELYEDHFLDKFDGFTFCGDDLTYNFDLKRISQSTEDEINSKQNSLKVRNLDELDLMIQDIVLLTDAYGAEGELGIVLSEKFIEHDAYCMFDALMSGTGGVVAVAEFFSLVGGSSTGLPPVIEASSAFYYLLSIVDTSLHSHLVELRVEPQYFALRWLRVLFGREFSLENLLLLWDEIFASDNCKLYRCSDDAWSGFGVLASPRGAFIAGVAVSMILYMRSSLLSTENATSCLQRLLNFPANANLNSIIAKAKSLQVLALDANTWMPLMTPTGFLVQNKSMAAKSSISSDSLSPRTPLSFVPESYWEEKWRDLNKAEEPTQSSLEKQVPNSNRNKKGWSGKVRLSLKRTESAPSSSISEGSKQNSKPSVRRSLLDDLSRQLGLEEDAEKIGLTEELGDKDATFVEAEAHVQCYTNEKNSCTSEERHLSDNSGCDGNSSIFSGSPSPGGSDHENQSGRSSVASNLSIDENNVQSKQEDSPLPVSDCPGLDKDLGGKIRLDSREPVSEHRQNDNAMGKPVAALKEQKPPLSGKFQWFWKLVGNGGDETSERAVSEGETILSNIGSEHNDAAVSVLNGSCNFSASSSKGDAVDQNVLVTLRYLGQSMLDNIQVIELAFQQERGRGGSLENLSRNVLVGKGQVTAMAALKELRKISNLLSEI